MKLEWERVPTTEDSERMYRAKVFGGWLVQTLAEEKFYYGVGDDTDYFKIDMPAMTFVPDKLHEWKIEP